MTIGDPVLRERAREVTPEELRSPEVQGLIDDLIETRRAANGAGLAANQVGETLRVAVAEVDGTNPRYPYKPPIPLTVMVNPVIEPVDDETFEVNEGCLSVPDLRGYLERRATIRVHYLDRDGDEHDEVRERSDRRDVSARGRSPRRRAVRGSRRPEDARDLGALRAPPARGVRGRALGPSSIGTALELHGLLVRDGLARRRVRRRGGDGRGRRRADRERGHRSRRPATPTRLDSTASRSRVSRTPTRTPSSARCAAGRTRAAGTSGAGGRRCTSWRHGSNRICISRWPARPTARWRWPESRASVSSTTSTTVLTERRTTTRTPWAGR